MTLAPDPLSKARVLSEALPWISRFAGKTFVIKYGGAAMKDGGLRDDFARDIVLLRHLGIDVVVVHGGGPQIDALLVRLGIQPKKVKGMRVTDQATMEVVEMVLGGKINQDLCALFNAHGGKAVGLSGHDGGFVTCQRMLEEGVDLGLVGAPVRCDATLILTLLKSNFIPVIAPVGADETGRSLNVNADLMAAAVAGALQAEKLVLLTDVEGVLDGSGELIHQLDRAEVEAGIAAGGIAGGMIPKVRCCLDALAAGVKSAHIVDGRQPHTLLLEAFTDRGIGTQIRNVR
jgi:acetylglutamate kinase